VEAPCGWGWGSTHPHPPPLLFVCQFATPRGEKKPLASQTTMPRLWAVALGIGQADRDGNSQISTKKPRHRDKGRSFFLIGGQKSTDCVEVLALVASAGPWGRRETGIWRLSPPAPFCTASSPRRCVGRFSPTLSVSFPPEIQVFNPPIRSSQSQTGGQERGSTAPGPGRGPGRGRGRGSGRGPWQ